MQDPRCVIAQAAEGNVKKLADEYPVKLARMYEIIGKDNPYPKILKFCLALAPHNPTGVRMVQADFNARIESMLAPFEQHAPTTAQIHDECGHVTSARLRGETLHKRKTEVLQAIAVLSRELGCIQRDEDAEMMMSIMRTN